MRVRLSRSASAFLRHERRYLEEFNPRAADNVLRQLQEALRFLSGFPRGGGPHPALEGRRRFVAGDYVIDYRIGPTVLEVSHIRHGRQLPPEQAKDGDQELE